VTIIIESRPFEVEEALADFIGDRLEEGVSRDELISALELHLMALREEADEDDSTG
jgi:hypothetical protein